MTGGWIPILHYRDFYDVPHAIVAANGDDLMVLDAPFDEEADDYPASFRVGTLRKDAVDLTGPWDLVVRATDFIGLTLISEVEFDQTKRKALRFKRPDADTEFHAAP